MDNVEVQKKMIGEEIARFREQKKMSRTDFVQKIGESSASLQNIELGRSYPELDFIMKFANEFRIVLSEVIDNGFKMKDIEVQFPEYKEEDLYVILQKVSLEKYVVIHNRESSKFLNTDFRDSNESFMGNLLHNERMKRKCSIEDLAENVDVRCGTIKNIESGSARGSFALWYKICSALRVPLDYFFVNQLECKKGAIDYLLYDIFYGNNPKERKYLLEYTKLFGDMYKRR